MFLRKNSLLILFAVCLFSAFLVVSCGGGGGGNNSSGGGTTTGTPTETASAATQAASVTMGSNEFFSNMTFFAGGFAGPAVAPSGTSPYKGMSVKALPLGEQDAGLAAASKLMAKFVGLEAVKSPVQKAMAAKDSGAISAAETIIIPSTTCYGGGSYDGSMTANTSGTSLTMNINYYNCDEGGTVTDGPMSIDITVTSSGDLSSATITMGTSNDPLTIEEYDYYGGLISSISSSISIKLTQNSAGTSMTMTANGQMTVTDSLGISYNLTYSNFAMTLTETTDSYGAFIGGTIKVNGKFSESWTVGGSSKTVSLTYANFTMSLTETSSFETITLDGSVTMDFTPNEFCSEGTYSFVTVTPVKYSYATGQTVEGEVTINNTVNITFNADGTLTIKEDGVVVDENVTELELSQVCEFETLD